jgi:hypothetical protein
VGSGSPNIPPGVVRIIGKDVYLRQHNFLILKFGNMLNLIDWMQAEVLVGFTLIVLFGIPLAVLIVYLLGAKRKKKAE